MGFGAMLVGHLNPLVVEHVERALHETGTLFVTPSPQATEMSERFCQRFGLDMIRFTNSGTESLMYAIRAARAYTERKAIVKIEGGYHGGYDALQVSVKPALADIGPADAPIGDVPFDVEAGTVHVVAYNDLPMLERILAQHGSEIAALVIEPVIENLAIVVPDEGYLAGVRALCDPHGVVLIFDEVKTGLTAGPAGAAQRLGVQPDLITLAKSIGGGLPLAAFGGKREVMEVVVDGRMAHFGTYNGNPLVMAAARRGRRDLHAGGARRGRGDQRARSERDRRGDLGVRAARPHGRPRRQGLRHLVDHARAQLPRLQGDRLRCRRAVLAVGRQPEHPHATRSRRAVARLVGAHRRRHGPSWSTTSASWPERCAAERPRGPR